MIHSRYRMIIGEQKTWYGRLGKFTYTVLLRSLSSPSLQRTEEDEGGVILANTIENYCACVTLCFRVLPKESAISCSRNAFCPSPFCLLSFSSWAPGSLARRRSIDGVFTIVMHYRHPSVLANFLIRDRAENSILSLIFFELFSAVHIRELYRNHERCITIQLSPDVAIVPPASYEI